MPFTPIAHKNFIGIFFVLQHINIGIKFLLRVSLYSPDNIMERTSRVECVENVGVQLCIWKKRRGFAEEEKCRIKACNPQQLCISNASFSVEHSFFHIQCSSI